MRANNAEERLGHDATVHALLAEALGSSAIEAPVRRTDTATILQRFAAGNGRTAAANVHAAEQQLLTGPPTGPTWLAQRWPQLCAAVALLAVAATFAQSWTPQASAPVHETQDPQEQPPRKLDFAQFQKLLHRVKNVFAEPMRVADHNLPFDVDISGTPVAFLSHSLEPFLECLPKNVVKLPAIEAEWMNRITLKLEDGSKVHGALYPLSMGLVDGRPTGGARLHVRGLDCDVRLNQEAGDMLRDLLDAATLSAYLDRGTVLPPLTLKSFSTSTKSLRLFRLRDEELSGLSRFPNLRRLDCSGLRKTLGIAGLRAITKACPRLEELVLDGMRFPDDFMLAITDLIRLQKLSLHGVSEFTGAGFHYITLSAKRRDGPTHLDLRYVPTLTDKGLERVRECDPVELLLQGSSKQITAEGLLRVASGPRLKVLDMQGWDLQTIKPSKLADVPEEQRLKALTGLLRVLAEIETVRR